MRASLTADPRGLPVIKAVVFDLDGTLVSSKIDFAGMKAELACILRERYGLTVSTKTTTADIVDTVLARVKGLKVSRVLTEMSVVMDRYESAALPTVSLMPGASSSLRRLKAMGLKTGVLTRGGVTYAYEALRRTGLSGLIDAVEARVDLLKAKPNPVALFNLCARLEAGPWESLVVGDHIIDLVCSRLSGACFIGFNPMGVKRSWPSGVETVDSLAEIPRLLLKSVSSLFK